MNIDIVEMKERHFGGVLELLKLTFSGVSKNNYFSEEFIRWKHFDNPHGRSKILLAITKSGKIVGFRAFMPWVFRNVYNDEFFCYRPVDSAIHPEFRSYGLFKKLTFKMLEDKNVIESDFIFNNPNANSLPIYTKEDWGWIFDSKIKFSIYPNTYKLCCLFNGKRTSNSDVKKRLELALNDKKYSSFITGTLVDNRYVTWRYLNNPAVNYFFYTMDGITFFVFRSERRGFLIELRLMDILCPLNSVRQDAHNLNMKSLSMNLDAKFDYLLLSSNIWSFVKVTGSFRFSPDKPCINVTTRGLGKRLEDIGVNLTIRDLELF